MAFERKEVGGDVFCLFRKVWANELASCVGIAKIWVRWQQLTAKIWAAKGVEAERTRQAEKDGQTDRQTQRQRWMAVPSEVQAGCMSSFPRSLLPWRGVWCPGLCGRAWHSSPRAGGAAWTRTAGPPLPCLRTQRFRVKGNSWGLVWLETGERKAREKRKKGRVWVKREECRRGWKGDLGIGFQIF